MGIPTRIVSTKTGDPSSGKIDDHLWGEHKAPTPYNFKGIEFNPAYFGTETVKCGDRILPLQKKSFCLIYHSKRVMLTVVMYYMF